MPIDPLVKAKVQIKGTRQSLPFFASNPAFTCSIQFPDISAESSNHSYNRLQSPRHLVVLVAHSHIKDRPGDRGSNGSVNYSSYAVTHFLLYLDGMQRECFQMSQAKEIFSTRTKIACFVDRRARVYNSQKCLFFIEIRNVVAVDQSIC